MIITLTMNPAVDKSASVKRIAPEAKLSCYNIRHDPGGGGINVSRVIKRLGGQSTAIFPVGGHNGLLLQELVEDEGVEYHAIKIATSTRENFTAFDETTEQQFRFGMEGAELTEKEWRECLEKIEGLDATYIIGSGSLPPGVPDDFYLHVGKIAQKKGAKLILDTSKEALVKGIEAGAYLLKPNMRELGHLTGKAIEDETQLESAARELIASGRCEVVVVSLGAGGALLVTKDLFDYIRAPIVPIRSTVGAGDSMVGGIMTGLLRGDSLQKAARYGVAAGAGTVMSTGTSLCNKNDVERLYQHMLKRENWSAG